MSRRKLVDYSFSTDENEFEQATCNEGGLGLTPTPPHLLSDTETHSHISSSVGATSRWNVEDDEESISGTVDLMRGEHHSELPPQIM